MLTESMNKVPFLLGIASLSLLLCILTGQACAQIDLVNRKPVPSKEELLAVQTEIKKFYSTELREARSVDAKQDLAQELLADAKLSQDDAVAQYALTMLSLDLASEASDRNLALDIADYMSATYDTSIAVARCKAMMVFAKANLKANKEQLLAIANESVKLVDPLLDECEYDLAQKAIDIAVTSSRRSRKYVLFRHMQNIAKDIDSIVEEERNYVKAIGDADESDDVGTAKTIMGRFECFSLGDWNNGLLSLSEGHDPKLQSLAEQTLKAFDKAEFPVRLTDQWWEVSEEYSGWRERVIKRFASSKYQEALPGLEGIQEKKAKSRIAESNELQVLGIVVQADGEQKPEQVAKQPQPEKRPVRVRMQREDQQVKYTTFGLIQLPKQEIDLFINQCKVKKAQKLQELQQELNSRSSGMAPEEIVLAKEMFEFVSKEEVLFIPRDRGGRVGSIFKPGYSVRYPYTNAETKQVIDKRSAIIAFRGTVAGIVEGIDTSNLPGGKWDSYLLLKRVADKQVQGIVGQKNVRVYQAVSSVGFPKDIILW